MKPLSRSETRESKACKQIRPAAAGCRCHDEVCSIWMDTPVCSIWIDTPPPRNFDAHSDGFRWVIAAGGHRLDQDVRDV